VREAYKSAEEGSRSLKAKVRGLREENRVLRKMVGWDPPPDDSEDDDEKGSGDGVAQGIGVKRGRGSLQGAAPADGGEEGSQ